LARLVDGLFSLSVLLSVIVVNDNSPDGTGILGNGRCGYGDGQERGAYEYIPIIRS
jgi:hypothetical protein